MHISEINIYPVKSLRGIALQSAKVEERGLQFDRRWMLVDEKRQFLTQREFPVMATIDVCIGEQGIKARYNGRSIDIGSGESAPISVKVWSSSVKADVADNKANQWFSEILGEPCRLVAMREDSKRIVNPFYAVRKFQDTLSFADGYPFLLIGEASLVDLNEKLDVSIPMNRFRPNFVVEGSKPFSEDDWKKIRIGETVFHVVKPCERCVITTVDQSVGVKSGKEPLATLAAYRNKNGKVLFGQNLIADVPGGMIKVGDTVEIVEMK